MKHVSSALLIALLGTLSPAIGQNADALARRVEAFLQPRLQTADTTAPDDARLAAILARPDPGTIFLRYAFGLKQHAKKLLTEEQRERLLAVLEKHTPAHSRWHDERNTLRCHWTRLMWRYAAAAESAAPALRRELEQWMRLRMLWTQQEDLAQYRFARDVWSVLTPDQQQKLLSGEWKAYAKQETGHTYDDATAKIILRALGKPDDKAAFDAAVAAWAEQRAPLHAAVAKTQRAERCIVFAMDGNSEAMAHDASVKATTAYAALFSAEADAIRRIVQAAYRDPSARCESAATKTWDEAAKRYRPGADELIQMLSHP